MSNNCCPPCDPIILDPIRTVQNFFHPQLIQVIQPIEIVQKHHCVPYYQHLVAYNYKEVGPQEATVSGKRSSKQRRKSSKR